MSPKTTHQFTTAAPATIAARLDRLPNTRSVWIRVVLLSLGGFFEFYDMFFTGYIGPGLVRSHILTPTTSGLFGATGLASFVAAMFSGLFLGTMVFSFLADRLGRRAIFTYSLLWYSAATVVMAFQNDAFGLNLWRFIVGIGVGVELVTIDAYLSEMVPAALRGRAFACNNVIQFSSVTVVALLSWLLVPRTPFGIDGWRWVMLIAAIGAVVRVVDSPQRSGKPPLARASRTHRRSRTHHGSHGSRRRRRRGRASPRVTILPEPETTRSATSPRSGKAPICGGPSCFRFSICRKPSATTASRTGCRRCLSNKASR